jgi:hypothetical protein
MTILVVLNQEKKIKMTSHYYNDFYYVNDVLIAIVDANKNIYVNRLNYNNYTKNIIDNIIENHNLKPQFFRLNVIVAIEKELKEFYKNGTNTALTMLFTDCLDSFF